MTVCRTDRRPHGSRKGLVLAIFATLLCVLAAPGCVLKDKPAANASTADKDTSDDLDATVTADVTVMSCPIPHIVDGRFTGWPDQTACAEWDVKPLQGVYGDLYMHYEAGRLQLLNDWHLRAEDIPATWYNLFEITTGNGAQQWDVRVFADGKIDVLLNGEKYGLYATGAYGFGPSPRYNQPHTMFEFAISGVLPGQINVSEKDPGPGNFPTPEQALKKEPKSFSGVLQQGGGIKDAKTSNLPILVGALPRGLPPGAQVTVLGSNLGDEEGQLLFSGGAATVTTWDDDQVIATLPDLVGEVSIQAVRSDGAASNTLPYVIACVQDCTGKECGPGKCGGSCGKCSGQEVCQSNGSCLCVPTCKRADGSVKNCGSDGCVGACGKCATGKVCIAGDCKDKPPVCTPDCKGKTCGEDGCGGSCGSCTATMACDGGKCVCVPQCKGKQCGEDGCGGTCGSCGVDQKCEGSTCSCLPSCAGKQCGKDGCGGTCGACPSGQTCTGVTCCKPECSGKSCGWDGCGGDCGSCGSGTYCVSGKCVCQPKCNGKVCGADGCGGTCGTCKYGTCVQGQCQCQPNCKDKSCGSDGCGSSCGKCDAAEKCEQGQCISL